MALDKRYMDTMVGVEKTALAEMTRAAFAVSAYNNAAVIAFNEKHGANSPINIIHDELAFRLYPLRRPTSSPRPVRTQGTYREPHCRNRTGWAAWTISRRSSST